MPNYTRLYTYHIKVLNAYCILLTTSHMIKDICYDIIYIYVCVCVLYKFYILKHKIMIYNQTIK